MTLPLESYSVLEDASAMTGVPVSTLRRWAANGNVPAYKVGKKLWLIDVSSIPNRGIGLRKRIETLIEKYKDYPKGIITPAFVVKDLEDLL